MPLRIAPPELLLILGIVVLLFGAGRIGKIAGELGSSIRAFKDNLDREPDRGTKQEK